MRVHDNVLWLALGVLLVSACSDAPTGTPRRGASAHPYVAPPADAPYQDSFEERAQTYSYFTPFLNWATITASKSIVHSGAKSLAFATQGGPGGKGALLRHAFSAPLKGRFAIWFYDAAPGQETLYEQMTLINTTQPMYAHIGTQDFDAFCYTVRLDDANGVTHGPDANCGIYPGTTTTNVRRTLGWHLLEIDIGAANATFAIDGATVFTSPGDFRFDRVDIFVSGPDSRPNTVGYFDDFSFVPLATTP